MNTNNTLIDTIIYGRNISNENIIGCFSNTVPVFENHNKNEKSTIIENVKIFQKTITEINNHSHFELINEKDKRSSNLFVYENYQDIKN